MKKIVAGFIVFLMLFSLVGFAYAVIDSSEVSYDDFSLVYKDNTLYKGENISLTGTVSSHLRGTHTRFPDNEDFRLTYQIVSKEFVDSYDELRIRGSIPAKTVGYVYDDIEGEVVKNTLYEVEFDDVPLVLRDVECGDEVYIVYRYSVHDDRGYGEQIYQSLKYGENAETFTGKIGTFEYSCEEKQTFIVGDVFTSIRQWFINLLNRLVEVIQNA